jgi:hypothetical protein
MIGLQDLPFDFSGIGIKALSRVWMLQRKYLWQLFMPSNINGVVGYLVSQYCQDVSFGPYGLGDVVKMQHGAFLRFYAGLQSIKTVNLSFMLPVDNTVLDYFYSWYHLMIDEQGYHHPKNNYSKQIYVSLYDRSGIESVKFIMKGTFPTSKPSVALSYNANDIQRVDISLSVDNIEMWSLTGSIRSGIAGLIGGVVGGVVGGVAANAVMGVGGGAVSRGLGKIL